MDQTATRSTLAKRAKAKYAQGDFIRHLAKLDSPLKSKYEDTELCSTFMIQNGDKLTARYCGHRWCRICNRIRTGKLINGYKEALDSMEDKQFLTLTLPNVKIEDLRETILKMTHTVRQIQDNRRKQKLPQIKCIRKLECTYNPDRDDFHPHFHFIVEGKEQTEALLEGWLQRVPEAERQAQNITEVTEYIELFKYFSKLTSKSSQDYIIYKGGKILKREEYHYPEAMDKIFQAVHGLRTIQPMGGIKLVSDEIDEVEVQQLEGVEEDITLWIYKDTVHDWYSPYTGELLSGYNPTEGEQKYRKRIRYLQDT